MKIGDKVKIKDECIGKHDRPFDLDGGYGEIVFISSTSLYIVKLTNCEEWFYCDNELEYIKPPQTEAVYWRHFYLYAKGHYYMSDLIDDLSTILAHETCVPKQCVNINDIIHILVRCVYTSFEIGPNKEHFFMTFIDNLLPENSWKVSPSDDFKIRLIYNCLSELRRVQVYDKKSDTIIYNIGDADPNVLPLSDSGKKYRKGIEKEIQNNDKNNENRQN